MRLSSAIELTWQALQEWIGDNGPRLGAALAFYAALSLYPLIVITLILLGFFLGKEGAISHLYQKIAALMGPDSAQIVQILLMHTSSHSTSGWIASLANLAVLLFGASGVFGELHDALNTIWHVQPLKGAPVTAFIVDRLFSFAMVLSIGFLLLVSLIISTILSFIALYFTLLFPGFSILLVVTDFIISFAVTAGLFALMFKMLPDILLRWEDVWAGAFITAALFDAGKYLIGIYLSHSSIMTSYGAAGSFVAFLVWIYYSAQILYIGAEFTKVSYRRKHRKVLPATAAP